MTGCHEPSGKSKHNRVGESAVTESVLVRNTVGKPQYIDVGQHCQHRQNDGEPGLGQVPGGDGAQCSRNQTVGDYGCQSCS